MAALLSLMSTSPLSRIHRYLRSSSRKPRDDDDIFVSAEAETLLSTFCPPTCQISLKVRHIPIDIATPFETLYTSHCFHEFNDWLDKALHFGWIEVVDKSDCLCYHRHRVLLHHLSPKIQGCFPFLDDCAEKLMPFDLIPLKIAKWMSAYKWKNIIHLESLNFAISVRKQDRPFLGFVHCGIHYRYQKMPLELLDSAYYSNVWMRYFLLHFIKKKNCCIKTEVFYQHHKLFIASDHYEALKTVTQEIEYYLRFFKVKTNLQMTLPQTELDICQYHINTTNQISYSQQKIASLLNLLKESLMLRKLSLKNRTRILSKLDALNLLWNSDEFEDDRRQLVKGIKAIKKSKNSMIFPIQLHEKIIYDRYLKQLQQMSPEDSVIQTDNDFW